GGVEGGERGGRRRPNNRAHFARVHAALAGYRAEGLFREMPDDCFASVVIGPAHDLARQWLAGRTRVALADCRELLAQVAWDSVRAA
ncbi:TetR family transcriptional regulator, partial [Pseudomonas aeruginosa]